MFMLRRIALGYIQVNLTGYTREYYKLGFVVPMSSDSAQAVQTDAIWILRGAPRPLTTQVARDYVAKTNASPAKNVAKPC
jgi:hypothetical protein